MIFEAPTQYVDYGRPYSVISCLLMRTQKLIVAYATLKVPLWVLDLPSLCYATYSDLLSTKLTCHVAV